MYYVKMTDSFLSGWGPARSKKAVFIYECETIQEAEIVAENAMHRSDQKDVRICKYKPRLSSYSNLVQWRTKEEDPEFYIKGYFNK